MIRYVRDYQPFALIPHLLVFLSCPGAGSRSRVQPRTRRSLAKVWLTILTIIEKAKAAAADEVKVAPPQKSEDAFEGFICDSPDCLPCVEDMKAKAKRIAEEQMGTCEIIAQLL
jgi:hypothetical protein